jgi:hypothetical protein
LLHIVLLVLKIIGIILLVLIGLLLSVLLIVLLVPVRYRVAVSHGEKLTVEGGISWLLHIIGARVSYLEGELHIRIRVLWITLYDNLKPPKSGSKRIKQRAAVKDRKKGTKKASKKGTKKVPEGQIKAAKQMDTASGNSTGKASISGDSARPEAISKPEIRKEIHKSEDRERPQVEEVSVLSLPEAAEKIGQEQKKVNVFCRIINKIKAVKDRITAFLNNMKNRIAGWFETFANVRHKFNLIRDFIRDEYNKEGFHITYSSLKRLLKHILPTKLKSRLVFGTGDPCSTGQALGAMGILYSFYGDKIVIVPDFENKRFEGEHFARGRIRLITVLIIVIKLILDKRFKQLRSNFQILKEAL